MVLSLRCRQAPSLNNSISPAINTHVLIQRFGFIPTSPQHSGFSKLYTQRALNVWKINEKIGDNTLERN